MDDYPPTTVLPGYTLSSHKHKVMFMTSNHFGSLPYGDILTVCGSFNRVWMLMDFIRVFADLEDGNFEKIQSELEDFLREEMFYGMATKQTTVNIFDEAFFPRPKGHMRRIRISFLDQYNTIIDFSLAKNNAIKTLEDLALNAVISNVTDHLVINKMEVPETLKMTLRKEFYNEWARKRFPTYNVTLIHIAESLKAGGIGARTLDLIMDDYMNRIELTRQHLATGLLDLNVMKEVWEPLFEKIARLGPASLAPLFDLNLTLGHGLFQSLKPKSKKLLLSKLWDLALESLTVPPT